MNFPPFFQTLATTIITKQLIGNLKESVLPYVLEKLKVYQMTYKLVEESVDMDDGTEDVSKTAKAENIEEQADSDNNYNLG